MADNTPSLTPNSVDKAPETTPDSPEGVNLEQAKARIDIPQEAATEDSSGGAHDDEDNSQIVVNQPEDPPVQVVDTSSATPLDTASLPPRQVRRAYTRQPGDPAKNAFMMARDLKNIGDLGGLSPSEVAQSINKDIGSTVTSIAENIQGVLPEAA